MTGPLGKAFNPEKWTRAVDTARERLSTQLEGVQLPRLPPQLAERLPKLPSLPSRPSMRPQPQGKAVEAFGGRRRAGWVSGAS